MTTRVLVILGLLVACGKSTAPAGGSAAGSGSAEKVAAADAALPKYAGIELPEVVAAAPLPDDGPTIAVSKSAIALDGQTIVALRDGVIDPAELEGGAAGMKITKLAAATVKLAEGRGSAAASTRIAIAFDREQSYEMLVKTLYTAKQKPGFTKFDLLVRSKGALAALPIDLPTRVPSASEPMSPRRPGADLGAQIGAAKTGRAPKPAPAPHVSEEEVADLANKMTNADDDDMSARIQVVEPTAEPTVKLVVTITKSEIYVWSISGLEGTLREPKLRLPRSTPDSMTKLNAALVEISKRRWPKHDETRDREIVVMPDRDTRVQVVAEVIAAVRQMPDGEPLFPQIVLASGFE